MEGAHIGHHADVNFLDGKVGARGAVTHVRGGHHVQSRADAGSVDRRQHRLSADLKAAEALLQLQNHPAQLLGGAALAIILDGLLHTHEHGQINT